MIIYLNRIYHIFEPYARMILTKIVKFLLQDLSGEFLLLLFQKFLMLRRKAA